MAMENRRPFDIAIIGAGIGGLSVGIILSLLHFRVAIIEKNALPGGLMRGYRRGGWDCPVGVHYFGSFGEGEPVRRICDYLGVTGAMQVKRMGRGGAIDRYLFDDFTFDLPEGVDPFAQALTDCFPDERRAIATLVGNLRAMADLQNSFAFFSSSPLSINPELFASLGAYLSELRASKRLRGVLGVAARWMGMSDAECPVFYHHLALVSYLLSAWRLRGSGEEMADGFVQRFAALGGTLVCGDPATAILTAPGAIRGVRLASGRVLKASQIVAAIHPKKAIELLPEGAVKPRHVRRLNELAETEGLFSLCAAVDAQAHPALPHNLFRVRTDQEGAVVDGVFYQLRRGRKGKNLLVAMTRSPYAEWRRWEQTTSGRRGPDYDREKALHADRLLSDAKQIFGSLTGAKIIDAYTPLTLRDWVNSPEGSPYGILRSMRQLPLVSVIHRLPPRGLWFAGQSALSPGVLGTLLGSLQTVRQLIGSERFACEVFARLMKESEK
jgi:all-trans-retinol 13,14-reductase